MKRLLIIAIGITMLTACEKWHDRKDKPCPTVASESVPAEVKKSFDAKYPATSVDTWFNKDNNGYAASFTYNGNKTLAQFANDGTFQKEEVDGDNNNQQGNHHDKDDDEGCECETGDND